MLLDSVMTLCILDVLTNKSKTMGSTLNIRIDKKMKEKAQKKFQKMGLGMSSGIKILISQMLESKSPSLQIRTENGFTPEQERRMIKETEWALKHGKSYSSIEELHKDILRS